MGSAGNADALGSAAGTGGGADDSRAATVSLDLLVDTSILPYVLLA
jgi:hypothetical protein